MSNNNNNNNNKIDLNSNSNSITFKEMLNNQIKNKNTTPNNENSDYQQE